jgi:hypothetical protein
MVPYSKSGGRSVMRFALYGMQIAAPEGLHPAFSETLNTLVVIDRDGGLESSM